MTDPARRGLAAVAAIPVLLLGLLALPAHALLVTTNADSGPGSLRQAIEDANTSAGVDTIEFDLDPSELVIVPLTSLPNISDPVIIDGTSQAGWAGAPLVEIDGSLAAGRGLSVTAGGSTIAALAIGRFDRAIVLTGNGGNHVRGCHLGTDSAGTGALGNSESGILIASDTNFIGGSDPADRNVISGNQTGVAISASGSSNVVIGNYIGTTADGNAALPNATGIRVLGNENYIGGTAVGERNVISGNARGVTLDGAGAVVVGNWIGLGANGQALGNSESGVLVAGTNNRIGGPHAEARNVISANGNGVVISGAGASGNMVVGNFIGTDPVGTDPVANSIGVRVLSPSNRVGGHLAGEGNVLSGNVRGVSLESDENVVEGNLIGLDASGGEALGNTETGVIITGAANRVGGTDPGAANVISSNGGGIAISGTSANDNVIEGNLIGTTPSGLVSRGNVGPGVRVVSGARNRIGGLHPAAGNVISGNLRGVTLEEESFDSVVLGNIIGLNAAATFSFPNREAGVLVRGPNNQIGGPDPDAGNIISGNRFYGIFLSGPLARGNTIEGNEIGTVLTTGGRLQNGTAGVRVLGAFDNRIGGTQAGSGNIISGNGSWGVFLRTGTGNQILGNSIFENQLLGIDHDLYGPTGNDPLDADFGPNLRQNHPILDSALASATDVTIEGRLSSEPDSSYRIEFFSSPTCDPSGFGQGKTFLGATTVMTSASGTAAIDTTLPVAVADPFVSATATSGAGNTSEFSPCALVGGPNPGVIQFVLERDTAREYLGEVMVTVSRSHGTAGTVSVSYSTFDDTATSPDDYTGVSGTLTFGPGEVLKTFAVPVHVDAIDDHGETFGLLLENPTGGATLGRAVSEIWLGDADLDRPTLFLDDAEVVEGDAGTTQLAFKVRLSPSSIPITVGYETVDGIAVAGVDYEATSGQVQFAPGETEKIVLVAVFGDVDPEGDEMLFLRTAGTSSATVTDGIAEGIVRDDDTSGPPPPLCVGGTTIAKPRLTLGALDGPTGNERAVLRGALEFAAGQPAGLETLDMSQRGAQLRIEDLGTGTILWERTADTHAVPAGNLSPSTCDPDGRKEDGWSVNASGTIHTYRNKTNALASAGCAPGSAEGLRRLTLKDRRVQRGQLQFTQVLRDASIASAVGPFRITIVLGADARAGQEGACGIHQFAPSDCQWNETGARLVCK